MTMREQDRTHQEVAIVPADASAALIDSLKTCKILSDAQLMSVQEMQQTFPDPKALTEELRKRKWLTDYQGDFLLEGRGDRLTLGQYVILERLGEGGMGEVFKAKHRLMDRIVALKVIRKECLANPMAIGRFYQEIRAAARLSHPNVVIAHDADHVNDTHYFVMEYVEGVDLAKLVKNRGPLSVGTACNYIRQAALGLQHAHEQGMIHRDIKPSNLLVTLPNEDQVKILDMGLARLTSTNNEVREAHTALTQEGAVMGTPDFISPEQSKNSREVDIRSDLYSLGCTLYYLITGQAPFSGDSLTEKLLKHHLEEAPPLGPGVPPEVEAITKKLMAKKPAERFQTPAELAEALRPFAQAPTARSVDKTEPDVKQQSQVDTPTHAFPTKDFSAGGFSTLQVTTLKPPPAPAKKKSWALVVVGVFLVAGLGLGYVATALDLFGTKKSKQGPPVDDVANVRPLPVDPKQDKGAGKNVDLPKPVVMAVGERELLALAFAWNHGGRPGNLPLAPLLWTGPRLVIPEPEPPKPTPKPTPTPVPQGPGKIAVFNHTAPITSAAISPDGTRVVFAATDNVVRLWEVATNRITPFQHIEEVVWSVTFSDDGSLILTGGGGYFENGKFEKGTENLVRLWDGLTGSYKKTFRFQADQAGKEISHGDSVHSVVFGPDNSSAASGGHDSAVRLWNVDKGRVLRTFKAPSFVNGVALSRSGKQLVVGCRDFSVRLWKLDSDRDDTPSSILKGHSSFVTAVAFTADSERILSASRDKTVRVWNAKDGKELQSYKGHRGEVLCVAAAPSGDWVLSGGSDQEVRLWDSRTGKDLHVFKEHEGAINSVAFSHDGQRAVSGGEDRSVRVWRLPPPAR